MMKKYNRTYSFAVSNSISNQDVEEYFDKMIYEISILNVDAWDLENLFGQKDTVYIGFAGGSDENNSLYLAQEALEDVKANVKNMQLSSILIALIGRYDLRRLSEISNLVMKSFEGQEIEMNFCCIDNVVQSHKNQIEVLLAVA